MEAGRDARARLARPDRDRARVRARGGAGRRAARRSTGRWPRGCSSTTGCSAPRPAASRALRPAGERGDVEIAELEIQDADGRRRHMFRPGEHAAGGAGRGLPRAGRARRRGARGARPARRAGLPHRSRARRASTAGVDVSFDIERLALLGGDYDVAVGRATTRTRRRRGCSTGGALLGGGDRGRRGRRGPARHLDGGGRARRRARAGGRGEARGGAGAARERRLRGERRRGRGRGALDDDVRPGRPTPAQLREWAVIEVDTTSLYSTRRGGAPGHCVQAAAAAAAAPVHVRARGAADALQRRACVAQLRGARAARRGRVTAVHQVLAAAGAVRRRDRAGARLARAARRARATAGAIYAPQIDPRTPAAFAPLARLRARGRTTSLVIHYSACSPRAEPLLETAGRGSCSSTTTSRRRGTCGTTSRHVAALCALGRDQLPAFAAGADVAVADSEFNAAELREAGARARARWCRSCSTRRATAEPGAAPAARRAARC